MGGQRKKKNICVGLLAHVDAGKTTLAEGLLYTCGGLRKVGRVDHGNAFLDNFAMERERGITIFAKQARLQWEDMSIALLDTPGHVDFSAEMERTLQVLDYAVLVISGADGVQGHVTTLWRLLKRYQIPVFLFVNKMDQEGTDREKLLAELQSRLDQRCVDFTEAVEELQQAAGKGVNGQETGGVDQFWENAAMCSEPLLEEYLETGRVEDEHIARAIWDREIFPCFFGSALKLQGVDGLLAGIYQYALAPEYPEQFGARVYKIGRDLAGNRLTYLKVTGGELKVKMQVGNAASARAEEAWEEKADQIRIYNGAQYTMAERVPAGDVCAVTGLTRTFVGQGLGFEAENELPMLEPVLTYQLMLPDGCDAFQTLSKLRQLEEEEPLLHLVWNEATKEIHVQVMGEVQIEVLKSQIQERFGLEVEFGTGSIIYKETIAEPVEGIGHFEPLRHYAEVHLLMEPGERGSGLQFASLCSSDDLDTNWQRLVLTHLEEKRHVGVLTGSEITDMKICLIAGRAHTKHTEGGDFRQSTYRAVRQGLRKSKSILLEPIFAYTLEVPTEMLGRAMSDIQRMHGSFEPPATEGEMSVLTGTAPVSTMRDYQREVNAYTRGHGRFSCVLKGYEPCHNAEEVIAARQYDPEADLANPTGSVFCAHGAGFVVNWDEVDAYAHVDSGLDMESYVARWEAERSRMTGDGSGAESGTENAVGPGNSSAGLSAADLKNVHGTQNGKETSARKSSASAGYITQEEIEAIFRQTYGKSQEDAGRYRRYHRGSRREVDYSGGGDRKYTPKPAIPNSDEHYFLVDGYNIIFAWPELRELAAINIDSARDKLMDILCNFQGFTGYTLILVFDAYKVKGNPGSVVKYHNINVVYTREAETADQYIEKTVHKIAQKYRTTVATSDALEQMIIWGSGAMRMSAQGLKEAVEAAEKAIREEYLK
ncbi:MAG: GTP-binding protein [Lachnospiraceae bacterium]|nr:GTP-binding protein [Lachnospiraceae bacterium]